MGADTDASSGGTVNAYIEEDEGIQSNNPVGIPEEEIEEGKTGPGLWANIHAKQNRIKHGSGEKMRKPGSKGAPSAQNFRDAAKEGIEEGVAEGSDDKEPFDYAKWKASNVKPRRPRGYKDAEAIGQQQREIDKERKERKEQGVAEGVNYPQKHSSWSVQSPKKNEFNTSYKLDQEKEARAHAERIGGKLVKVDQKGHAIKASKGVAEDLDANQKRVGQLGPTEKVKNNNIGKLVGANESVESTMKLLDMLSENFINSTAQAVTTEAADYGDLENEYYYVIDTQSGEVVDGPFDNVGEVPLRLMGFDGGHKVVKGAELKGHDEVTEGRVDSPVSQAITRRIINQRPDLLKYGPDNVMAAVDQVAEWVDLGPDDEIGTSDVSGWVDQVARYLRTQAGEGLQFTEDESFNKMMNKMTSKSALDTREATAMMFDLIHDQGASYEEALHQASVSYEIDPAELKAAYQQSQGTDKEGIAEGQEDLDAILRIIRK
jgi:hypothetical protein